MDELFFLQTFRKEISILLFSWAVNKANLFFDDELLQESQLHFIVLGFPYMPNAS
jgi:hypothetical protein